MNNIQYCFKDLLFVELRTNKKNKICCQQVLKSQVKYEYKYLGFKHEYLDLVLEYNSSTSTSTKYYCHSSMIVDCANTTFHKQKALQNLHYQNVIPAKPGVPVWKQSCSIVPIRYQV